MMVKHVEKLIGHYLPLILLLIGPMLLMSCTRKGNDLAYTWVLGQVSSPAGKPVKGATVQIGQTIFRPDLTDNNEGFSKVESEDARTHSDEQGDFQLGILTEPGLKEIQIAKDGQLLYAGTILMSGTDTLDLGTISVKSLSDPRMVEAIDLHIYVE